MTSFFEMKYFEKKETRQLMSELGTHVPGACSYGTPVLTQVLSGAVHRLCEVLHHGLDLFEGRAAGLAELNGHLLHALHLLAQVL